MISMTMVWSSLELSQDVECSLVVMEAVFKQRLDAG